MFFSLHVHHHLQDHACLCLTVSSSFFFVFSACLSVGTFFSLDVGRHADDPDTLLLCISVQLLACAFGKITQFIFQRSLLHLLWRYVCSRVFVRRYSCTHSLTRICGLHLRCDECRLLCVGSCCQLTFCTSASRRVSVRDPQGYHFRVPSLVLILNRLTRSWTFPRHGKTDTHLHYRLKINNGDAHIHQ